MKIGISKRGREENQQPKRRRIRRPFPPSLVSLGSGDVLPPPPFSGELSVAGSIGEATPPFLILGLPCGGE